jgi:hypothetical protein
METQFKKDKSSSFKKTEMFQVDLETILPETTTDGKVNVFFIQ